LNKIDFNQEYNLLNKKFKETKSKKSKFQEYNLNIAINDMLKTNLISSRKNLITLGAGKEAFVILGKKNSYPVCVKSFKPFSQTNIKRKKAQHHISEFGMSSVMARDEFQNLKILKFFGVNVPQPFEYNKSLSFSMELLKNAKSDGYQAAPLLRDVHLKKIGLDPVDVLEDILNQVDIMFNKANMVHGDLSEFNLIFSDNKPYIIDVSQSRLVNFKTYTNTPIRIRIDRAIEILERDVTKVVSHFTKKYRVHIDIKEILIKLSKNLPDFTKKYNLLEKRHSSKTRVSRTFFMNSDSVKNYSNQNPRAKQRRIHSKISFWEEY
jgi:serine/threonine-protein kinase RIO1